MPKSISGNCLNILSRIKMSIETFDGQNKIITFYILDDNSLETNKILGNATLKDFNWSIINSKNNIFITGIVNSDRALFEFTIKLSLVICTINEKLVLEPESLKVFMVRSNFIDNSNNSFLFEPSPSLVDKFNNINISSCITNTTHKIRGV